MPLPADERIISLSQDLVQQFDTIFGLHPGFRPAHAKGTMLVGTFTPSAGAASLSRAPHLNRKSTPVTVRFSNSTGVPLVFEPLASEVKRELQRRNGVEPEPVHVTIPSTDRLLAKRLIWYGQRALTRKFESDPEKLERLKHLASLVVEQLEVRQ